MPLRSLSAHRWVVLAGFTVGWLLLAAQPVLAKTPPFTIEVSDDSPVVGSPVVITVHFEPRDPDIPESFEYLGTELKRLVGAFPGESLVFSEEIPITLERYADGLYRGVVTFSEPGIWRIWSFPGVLERQGIEDLYTNYIEVEVRPAPNVGLGSIMLGLLLIALVAALVVHLRGRRPSFEGWGTGVALEQAQHKGSPPWPPRDGDA